MHLQTNLSIISHIPVLTLRDTTQNVMYQRLISEEKSKSDLLLSSILPSNLLQRVKAGEQNISFSVQNVAVLFLDIVQFTPWCGSLPASTVMSTLNRIFVELDRELLKYPTLTKIKCIGDCYMAAGGVFTEVSQPAVHAKEMVQFGIDAIHGLEMVNKELQQNLRIRVGVNVGGPIVAGIIGTKNLILRFLVLLLSWRNKWNIMEFQ
jgi:class 3 adenylate cyclase